MFRILQRISVRSLILTNALTAIAYGIASWHLSDRPLLGFLSLLLPYLLLLLVCHLIGWLLVKPLYALPTLFLLIATHASIRQVLPIHPGQDFSQAPPEGSLRVMTWNLRSFTPFDKIFSEPGNAIRHGFLFDEVQRFSPDVVCFQELTDAAKESSEDPVDILRRQMGYRYHFFPGDELGSQHTVRYGTAIFSKHPILRAAQVRYSGTRFSNSEHTLWADLLWNGDTVRVHVMHLQSYRFLPGDYRTLAKMREDSDQGLHGALLMYRKLRNNFIDHAEQSRWLRGILDTCRYPMLVCADLNNVPASYAYRTLLKDGKDTFTEKGTGFGRTYINPLSRWMGSLPTLRIDYILTSPIFETLQVTRGKARLSDHQAVVADLRLPQKE